MIFNPGYHPEKKKPCFITFLTQIIDLEYSLDTHTGTNFWLQKDIPVHSSFMSCSPKSKPCPVVAILGTGENMKQLMTHLLKTVSVEASYGHHQHRD